MSMLQVRMFCLAAVAALVTACGGGVVSPPPSQSNAASTIPASSTPAVSATPAPIAAKGQIVFFDDPGGSGLHQVYIEQADGSNVHKLISSSENDLLPSFSPDGSMVVFSRMDPAVAKPDRIYVVNVDGSGLHQLEPGGCPGRCGDAVEGHAWSPDGSRIVFTRAIFDGKAGTPFVESDRPHNVGLWVMKADGSGAHQITLEGMRCGDGGCTGGGLQAGEPGEQHDEAGWSPDSTRIIFLRDVFTDPEQYGVFTVAADGTDLQRVTPEGMNVGDPDWSPVGELIVFQSPPEANEGGEQNIFTIHLDGTGLTQLTTHMSSSSDGRQGTFHPSWSPDGTQLAFTHSPSTNGQGDIYVMNRDGTGLRLLAASDLNENGLFWGPSPTN